MCEAPTPRLKNAKGLSRVQRAARLANLTGMRAFLKQQVDAWGKVMKDAGLEPQ